MGQGKRCSLGWIFPYRVHIIGNYQIERELNLDYLKLSCALTNGKLVVNKVRNSMEQSGRSYNSLKHSTNASFSQTDDIRTLGNDDDDEVATHLIRRL